MRSFNGRGQIQDLQMSAGQRLEAGCDECSLRVEGDFAELRLQGKENFVTLKGRVDVLRVDGSQNVIECLDSPARVELTGHSNRVKISERPGRRRPQIKVQGSDQGVNYRPYQP